METINLSLDSFWSPATKGIISLLYRTINTNKYSYFTFHLLILTFSLIFSHKIKWDNPNYIFARLNRLITCKVRNSWLQILILAEFVFSRTSTISHFSFYFSWCQFRDMPGMTHLPGPQWQWQSQCWLSGSIRHPPVGHHRQHNESTFHLLS